MKKRFVCNGMIGSVQFSLYFKKVDGDDAGTFLISNDGVSIEIESSCGYGAQETLWHELQEVYMLTKGMAYRQSGGILTDCSEGRTFTFNHLQFNVMIKEVFYTFSECEGKLTKAVKAK